MILHNSRYQHAHMAGAPSHKSRHGDTDDNRAEVDAEYCSQQAHLRMRLSATRVEMSVSLLATAPAPAAPCAATVRAL